MLSPYSIIYITPVISDIVCTWKCINIQPARVKMATPQRQPQYTRPTLSDRSIVPLYTYSYWTHGNLSSAIHSSDPQWQANCSALYLFMLNTLQSSPIHLYDPQWQVNSSIHVKHNKLSSQPSVTGQLFRSIHVHSQHTTNCH